jgi:uncharacterized protein YbaP (TraB family)
LLLAACGSSEPARDWPTPSPALWHVSGPDGAEGWLFGTVHALPEGATWTTPLLDVELAKADLLLVEIAQLGDTTGASEAFQGLAHSEGLPPLLARVDPARRGEVSTLLAAAGRDEDEFADVETWAAAIMLSGAERVGDPALGVDRALLRRGPRAEGLEDHRSQLAIFDELPQTEQVDLLVAVSREAAAHEGERALEDWLRGDVSALERRAFAGMMGDAELREALMDGRNRAWMDRITAAMTAGHCPFVAVGAAHMLGDGGLPALLAAGGYTVTRIQ